MTLKIILFLWLAGLNFLAGSNSFIFKMPDVQPFLMERALERITKKPFGLYVSPSNSPVTPERFSGYHTGVDFEIFEDEFEVEIPIYAICEGGVRFVDWVSGYGGVLIQNCILGNAPVTVLYGHIDLDATSLRVGDILNQGDLLGRLGDGFSLETDGERKHLHLAIHRGDELEFRGYVSAENELEMWLNPLPYLE